MACETTLWQFKSKLEGIDRDLSEAFDEAKRLGLTGTAHEIDRARSHLDSIMFEIDRKREPEFAAFK